MSYSVRTVPNFDREIKKIAKKHKGIKSDLAKLIHDLEVNPTMGTDLGQNFYKIRISVSGTNKGKSGGARIITYVLLDHEVVLLSEIYLKSENDTVDINVVLDRLKDDGLI